MNKKSLLALIAITLFTCSSASAQFVTISPSDLVSNPTAGQVFSVSNVDISNLFGLNPGDLNVSVANAVVGQNTNFFAVNETSSTLFAYSGVDVEAFVQHGRVLGNNFANGQPTPRDGVSSTSVFSLDPTVTTSLDSDYRFGSTATDYFVEYTGGPNNEPNLQNSSDFRFVSNGPVTNYTVFSDNNNGTTVNNNFSTGLQVVNAVPEPSAGIVLALTGLLALRRKRS